MHWLVIFAGISLVLLFVRILAEWDEITGMKPCRDMKRFISDEEFLAACSVKDPEVALKVRAIISDQLDIPLNNIHPNDRFVQELGCW